MKKKILITGVAGFIGSKLARKLIEKGNYVIGIDNLVTGYKKNIPAKVNFFYGDCSNYKQIVKIDFKNVETIFHLAGQSGGVISFDDPIKDMKYNLESTLNLLNLAVNNRVRNFFYASSVAVYGQKKSSIKVSEIDRCNPLSFYGQSKFTSENYLELYKKFYKINGTSLRLFNTYGPGQDLNNLRQGMLSIYLSQAIRNKKIIVNGSVDRFRDFVHVDDVVSAFVEIMKKKNLSKAYNVCYGVKTSVKKAIKLISKNLPYAPRVTVKGKTLGDQFGVVGNNNLLKKKIKWKRKFENIEIGIENFVCSYFK